MQIPAHALAHIETDAGRPGGGGISSIYAVPTRDGDLRIVITNDDEIPFTSPIDRLAALPTLGELLRILDETEVDGEVFGRELDGDEPVHCVEGTPGAALMPDFHPRAGEHLIRKRRYSAFFMTDLDLLLRGLNVRTVVVCGFLTDVCVHYTCADAPPARLPSPAGPRGLWRVDPGGVGGGLHRGGAPAAPGAGGARGGLRGTSSKRCPYRLSPTSRLRYGLANETRCTWA
ncbi:MAG: cysteine hydrolase family protein [Thermoleophilaceae bacterium]